SVITSQVDPLGPDGITLNAYLYTDAKVIAVQDAGLSGGLGTASADFGHTGEFPGLLALDAQGNILPDAANWVSVTSDSGIEYGILTGIPSSVPEPSSF